MASYVDNAINTTVTTTAGLISSLSSLSYLVLIIISIILANQCRGTVDVWHILAAICCPVLYAPYGMWCAFYKNKN